MNLDQLIDALESYREEVGGEAEVRLMTQRENPLQKSIHGVISTRPLEEGYDLCQEPDDDSFLFEDFEYDEHAADSEERGAVSVIYITEGETLGLGKKLAWTLED